MNTPRPAGEILLINKPYGWSSFQTVKKIKWVTRAKRVGHAGTLDPLADGLLVICTEGSTRKIEEIQSQEKEYTGIITLGNTTPSHDLETEPNAHFPIEHITEAEARRVAETFLGEITQIPPLYSAIKVDGKRAYKLAREGVSHEMKSRKTTIREFEITRFQLPDVEFRVVCSKGTYIRTLAFDFGKALNSGAHLSKLCRTRIGDFKLSEALSPAEFERKHKGSTETGKNAPNE